MRKAAATDWILGSLLATLSGMTFPGVVASGCSSGADPATDESGGSGGRGSAGKGGAGGKSGHGGSGTGGSKAGGGGSDEGGGNGGSGGSSGQGGSSMGGSSGSGGSAGWNNGVFQHPGVLVNGPQIAFVKGKVAAGAEPWTAALKKAKTRKPPSYVGTEPWASLTYTPSPVPDVCCGSNTAPDVGCRAEQFDAAAAYTDALIWAVTGDEQYAKQSIKILNAYSSVLKSHVAPDTMCGSPPGKSSNTPVQTGWTGALFPRAGELMRMYPGWNKADIERFSTMLKTVFVPNLVDGAIGENGNWELSMAEALVQIGVFLDDRATFQKGVDLWRRRLPAYFYLTSDGPKPVMLPGQKATWLGASHYFNGLSQETCRDLGHVQYSLAATINAAETARIQGLDLYAEEATRIVAGLELAASYLNGATTPDPGCPYSAGTKLGFPNPASNDNPLWEIAYNHYVTRSGMKLPNTEALITKIRPTAADHHMAWETLSHAEVGAVGLPPIR